MKLVIGGYAQGKLRTVCKEYEGKQIVVWDGEIMEESYEEDAVLIWNHFHLWVRNHLEEGEELQDKVEKLLEKYSDCILISDEIGNGIVPLSAEDREYRELTGRLLCRLAERAEEVERILCGLRQRIK